ncbi:MAG TPA: hypothetical protein VND83_02390 [Acidimicrobiales bacterium]|nr:hypothetical protein [Acidimicrobiales bacterium]
MKNEEIKRFFDEKVPRNWFSSISVDFDGDEIWCVGELPADVKVEEFRESTRAERMGVAEAAEDLFRRKVSWGVSRDGVTTLFTHLSTPVMTRLRLRERAVLDTLIESGVARSRSEALAWCVKLVGRHETEWLAELREALAGVESARTAGPSVS